MRYPAALPSIALAGGIATGIFLPVEIPAFLPALIWTTALAAFVARHDLLTTTLLGCGFVISGSWLGNEANIASNVTPLGSVFERHLTQGGHQLFASIDGRLRVDATRSASGVTLNLLIESLEIDGARHTSLGGALIGVGGEVTAEQILQWRAGRRVAFPATLRRPTTYLDWGVADSQRQLAWRGTTLVGSVKSGRLVDVVARGSRLDEALASARAAVRQAVAARVAPWSDQSAAIVTAVLIGDRAGLSEDIERRLQEAGTYHVIAISGGNIAIFAAILVWMLKMSKIRPGASAGFSIAMLGVYALVVEGGSSVRRATLMAAVYFFGRMWDHATPPMNVAALAAAILLFAEPLQVVDAGFALSFGATLGIVIGLAKVANRFASSRWLWMPAALLAASICAEAALLPISAFVFSRVTFAGVIVNFAAIPLMTLIQVSGMAVVAFDGTAARLADWAAHVAHLGVAGLIGSARLVDVAPWLARRLATPSLFVVTAYYCSILLAFVVAPTISSRSGLFLRRVARIATVACALWIITAPSIAFGDRPLRVTFLDVGQGDAAVVQLPSGHTLSVDAGGASGSSFDIGGRVVAPAFWALGVRRLDYLSVSHSDVDHIGGAASVLRDFRPSEVWEGVPVPPHRPTQQLRILADLSGVVWRTLRAGDRLRLGAVDLVVHHPPLPEWERQRVRNDDSEVLELRFGGVSFVFSGDIGREIEHAIARSFDRAPIRILKVPHHGSASSSSQAFLTALDPDIAVISAGRGNPFGHPVANVVERYRSLGAAIYRTDQDGATTMETDGTTLRVRTFMGRRLTLTTHGR